MKKNKVNISTHNLALKNLKNSQKIGDKMMLKRHF